MHLLSDVIILPHFEAITWFPCFKVIEERQFKIPLLCLVFLWTSTNDTKPSFFFSNERLGISNILPHFFCYNLYPQCWIKLTCFDARFYLVGISLPFDCALSCHADIWWAGLLTLCRKCLKVTAGGCSHATFWNTDAILFLKNYRFIWSWWRNVLLTKNISAFIWHTASPVLMRTKL